jgi:hypothetical protein
MGLIILIYASIRRIGVARRSLTPFSFFHNTPILSNRLRPFKPLHIRPPRDRFLCYPSAQSTISVGVGYKTIVYLFFRLLGRHAAYLKECVWVLSDVDCHSVAIYCGLDLFMLGRGEMVGNSSPSTDTWSRV